MAAAYEPPVSDDRGELVIRPSWRALSGWEIPVVAFMVFGLGVGSLEMYAKYHSIGWALALLGIGALFIAGYALYLVAYMTSTRITVTADAIFVTHWFRSTAIVAPSDIARVVRISLAGSQGAAFARPAVFAFSAKGALRPVLICRAMEQGGPRPDLAPPWHHAFWLVGPHDPGAGSPHPGAF